MRIAVGLLACLGAGALTSALADPSTETAPAATAGPATTVAPAAPAAATPAPATETSAATQVISAKAELDRDTAHFVAEGYKPEMRNGEQIYCKKETVLGSRVNGQKRCGTLEQLKLGELGAKENVSDIQRRQTGTSTH